MPVRFRFLVTLSLLAGLLPGSLTASGADFSIYGGYNLPVGDYGASEGKAAGYARGGFGGGVLVSFPVASASFFDLSLAAGTGFVLSRFDADQLENEFTEKYSTYWEDKGLQLTLTGISLDADSYLHIPVMSGVAGSFDARPGFRVYGLLMAGICFSKFPDLDFPMTVYSGITSEELTVQAREEHLNVASSFCFSIGVGVLVGGRFEFGLQYLDLGTPSGDAKTIIASGLDSEETRFAHEQRVSMILFTAGVRI